jgi:NADH-quinone oxidoreductase subunit C
MMDSTKLMDTFPEAILSVEEFRGDVTVTLKQYFLLEICTFLRDDPDHSFRFLIDVTAIDYNEKKPRFVVVYHLLSHERNQRLRLKVPLEGDEPEIETITGIWPSANWHERETYDLLGVRFLNHPDLRRILLPDHWDCHPLRKDYPLEGKGEDDDLARYENCEIR